MIKKRSVYECPVCGNRTEDEAGKRILCGSDTRLPYHKVVMREIRKGVITK